MQFNRFVEQRPAASRLLVEVVVACALAGACHEFRICHDDQCRLLGAAGAGAEAGAGGDDAGEVLGGRSGVGAEEGGGAGVPRGGTWSQGMGGEGGVPLGGVGGTREMADCEAPYADCDESTFTGCETNLATDLNHCGACGATCWGVCDVGHCRPFEDLAFASLALVDGIAPLPTEAHPEIFALGDSLLHWSEEAGPATVLMDASAFRGIFAGNDGVYALGPGNDVSTIPFVGGGLTPTGLKAQVAFASPHAFYAVDENGAPYRIFLGTGKREALPLPSPAALDASFLLAGDEHGDVALLVSMPAPTEETGYSYSLYTLVDGEEPPAWRLRSTGRGKPFQARCKPDDILLDVTLNADQYAPSEPEAAHELRSINELGETRALRRLSGVVGFELAGDVAYVSSRQPGSPEREGKLTLVPLDQPDRAVELPTSSSMASITYLNPYFYFGATRRSTLTRLQLWL